MIDAVQHYTLVRRVELRLRAGISGFDAEPDLSTLESLGIPTSTLNLLKVNTEALLAVRTRDQGMEPMLFEDDWIVIDTSDTVPRSGEVFAANWNGEACVQQLVYRGGQWYLSYANPSYKPINIRSGDFHIVGRVIYQEGRSLIGKL